VPFAAWRNASLTLFVAALSFVPPPSPRDDSDQSVAPSPWAVRFTDIGQQAGLRTDTVYGGLDRKRFIIETNGAGTALIDYDNDGWLDALTLSGTRL
jgi:hypothetical protein